MPAGGRVASCGEGVVSDPSVRRPSTLLAAPSSYSSPGWACSTWDLGFCCFWSEAWPPDGRPNLGGVTVLSQLQHSPLPPSLVSRPGHGCPLQLLALLPRTWFSGHPAQHSGPRPRVPAGRLVLPQDAVSHWGHVHGFGHGASGAEPVRWGSVGSLRAEGMAGWSHSGT